VLYPLPTGLGSVLSEIMRLRHNWCAFAKQGWSLAFERGLAGVLFAMKPNDAPANLARKN